MPGEISGGQGTAVIYEIGPSVGNPLVVLVAANLDFSYTLEGQTTPRTCPAGKLCWGLTDVVPPTEPTETFELTCTYVGQQGQTESTPPFGNACSFQAWSSDPTSLDFTLANEKPALTQIGTTTGPDWSNVNAAKTLLSAYGQVDWAVDLTGLNMPYLVALAEESNTLETIWFFSVAEPTYNTTPIPLFQAVTVTSTGDGTQNEVTFYPDGSVYPETLVQKIRLTSAQ